MRVKFPRARAPVSPYGTPATGDRAATLRLEVLVYQATCIIMVTTLLNSRQITPIAAVAEARNLI